MYVWICISICMYMYISTLMFWPGASGRWRPERPQKVFFAKLGSVLPFGPLRLASWTPGGRLLHALGRSSTPLGRLLDVSWTLLAVLWRLLDVS